MGDIYLFMVDSLRVDFTEDLFDNFESSDKAVSNFDYSLPAHNGLLTLNRSWDVTTFSTNSRLDIPTAGSLFSEEGYRTVMISRNGYFRPEYGFNDFDEEHLLKSYWMKLWSEDFKKIRNKDEDFRDKALTLLKNVPKNPVLLKDCFSWLMYKLESDFDIGDSGSNQTLEIMDNDRDEDQFFAVNIDEVHWPRFPPYIWCIRKGEFSFIFNELRWFFGDNSKEGTINDERKIEVQRKGYKLAAKYIEEKLVPWIEKNTSEEDIIIITSDHGELLGEDSLIGHHFGCRPEQFHVPFFYKGDVDFPDFFGLDQLTNYLLEREKRKEEFSFDEEYYLYSYSGHGIGKWSEDQKALINEEIRKVIFEESDKIEFFEPFTNSKKEAVETSEIPEPERKEDFEPDDEVKSKLRDLGYI